MWPHKAYPFNLAAHVLRFLDDSTESKAAVEIVTPDGLSASLTRVALRQRVEAAASLLQQRYQAGDRLAIVMHNDLASIVMFLAVMRAGCIVVPLSSQSTDPELDLYLGQSQADHLFYPRGFRSLKATVPTSTSQEFLEKASNTQSPTLPATLSEDPAMIIFTSGTGGVPKGVLHAHRMMIGRQPMTAGWHGISHTDRVMHAGKLNWTYTIGVGLLDPLSAGATAILADHSDDPAIWTGLITRHGITAFAAAPAVYRRLIKYGDIRSLKGSSLIRGLSAGEPLSTHLADTWTNQTRTPVYESLGMSEVSTYISSSSSTPPIEGAAGTVQPGRRVTILADDGTDNELPLGQEGLLAVHRSDPGLMLGYWCDEALSRSTCHGEWFVGGDRAVMTEDQHIFWKGRHDDLLNISGIRISPVEIENVLSQFAEIADCAVAETVNHDNTSILTAFCVPKSDGQFYEEACRQFVADKLSRYKQPRKYVLCNALPRTANGKIMRGKLTR